MSLRARLACLFLALLLIPLLSISLISLDYLAGMMIGDLSRGAEYTIAQIFEQMRLVITEQSTNSTDLAATLRSSASLRKSLDSAQAFGPAVVTAEIVAPDGTVIVGAHGANEGQPAVSAHPIAELEARASRWWSLAAVHDVLTPEVYEERRQVEINNRPVATIVVGMTTALTAGTARHLLEGILATGAVVTLFGWLCVSLVANGILRQLAAITRGFEQLAGGTRVELNVEGEDELSTLAEKFNELSRKVQTDRARLDTGGTHLFDVVRSIQDAILLLDSTGAVLFANQEARQLLVPDGSSIEGAPLTSMLPAKHPLSAMIQSTLEAGTESRDIPMEIPAGGKPYLVSFFRMGGGRRPAGLLAVLRNLAPVIELQTALDYSNRLARLGSLISGIAHQLRSPLHSINLRLELLRRDKTEGGADRHVDRLQQEVRRLDQAVEALLRFMRPQDLKVTDFDANDLLKELAGRVRSEIITVDHRLDPNLPRVRGDRGLISEALMNVITNAVQAMTPGGGVLTLASRANGSAVELRVADRGPGISEEDLRHVFDLYYTTKPSGSGLGLSFALRAVELNGGSITLDSKVGQGTTCTINLRIGDSENPHAAEPKVA